MSAVPSSVPAADPALLVRRAIAMAGVRVGRDGVLVVPASRLEERSAAITVSTGIAALDQLSGGIPRGALTEICGPASSGRTSVLLSLMARMTQANEVCALVDASDSFDPHSAEAAGVELKRVLWVRCSSATRSNGATGNLKFENFKISNSQSSVSPYLRVDAYGRRKEQMSRVEQALKATDLLLQGGGFGLVVVDLAGIAPDAARRVPLTSWFRFRRAVENTATALVVLEQEPYAKTCASVVIQLSAISSPLSVKRPTRQPSHAALLGGLEIHAEVVRDRQQRKPVRSAEARWESRAQFAI
jgi:recombination protein RecA